MAAELMKNREEPAAHSSGLRTQSSRRETENEPLGQSSSQMARQPSSQLKGHAEAARGKVPAGRQLNAWWHQEGTWGRESSSRAERPLSAM